jgi:hypothetical protein
MEIRVLTGEDYDRTLVKWWEDWEWSAPPKETLPDNGTGGFMVHKGDTNICAGFLYQTNSKIAWCEFVISNKDYKEKDRGEAIELLINAISLTAKEQGYKAVWTSLRHKALIKRYEKNGFKQANTDCVEMVKIL